MAQDKGSKTRQADGNEDEDDLGAGPGGGKIRHGPDSSKPPNYAQEVTSSATSAGTNGLTPSIPGN